MFQFKQFSIYQENSGMKLTADAVLFGAWTFTNYKAERILDIGCGTGILSLIAAQKTSAIITAIDIDDGAIKDTNTNINETPWQNRINVIHSSIQNFTRINSLGFDLIVSNPPFYEHSLDSLIESRTLARKNITLSYLDLLKQSKLIMDKSTRLSILLPTQYSRSFIILAESQGIYLKRICEVHETNSSPSKICFMVFSLQNRQPQNEKLYKLHTNGIVTTEYFALIKDFYTNI